MIFSSLVFLWIFLPVTLGLYFLSKEKYRNALLLLVSLFFYAWGEPVYVFIMILSILLNYVCGLFVAKDKTRKPALWLGILINLGLLGFFKYSGFFTENVNQIFGLSIQIKKLPLPIGISFYTFQSLSYLVDIYRREVKAQKNIIKMGLFISFFPQLIAGPILKYHDIAEQINNRRCSWSLFNEGARRFILGLGKKVILANIMAQTADAIFNMEGYAGISTPTAWIGIFAYTMQIFFDFSGYSEMAIGLGKMFGFDIKENFNIPYIAQSIQDFWRRWHISLSTWFKEYLYIPLGGNRHGKVKTYRNLFIVFFMTGLWHGASWSFILWGLFHGFFIIFERIVPIKRLLPLAGLRWIYCMLVVMVGWVFFRVENIADAFLYLKKMFIWTSGIDFWEYLTNEFICVGILAVLAAGLAQTIYAHLPFKKAKGLLIKATSPVFCCVLLYLSILLLANNTYNPFIYFRF